MNRIYAVVMTLACASSAVAADLPTGTWRKTFESGATWTVTLDGKGAKWVGTSSQGTNTLIAPVCRTEEDGVAFGYVRRMLLESGESKTDHSGIYPYGFAFVVKGDSLTITDFQMVGYPPEITRQMAGDYVKVAEKERTKAAAEPIKAQK